MSYIKIDNVVKKFGEKTVIKGISLEFEKGEFISFLGFSGCGKTTMLRMIAGFEEPTSGRIEIDGKVLYSDKDKIMLPPGKRNLGMVFQSYAVWPHMNLFDNVAYPLKIQKVDKAEIERRTMEMLDVVAREKLAELNSGIAGAAAQNGAQVADVASAFKGNAAELTNITQGDIHPSKAGHAAIYSLLCEMTEPSVPTNSDVPVKGSPDTGAEGIAVVTGIAALSAAGLFFSRRR